MGRSIESSVLKITTEKKLAVKPGKVFLEVELSGCKDTFSKTKFAANKAKKQFEAFMEEWAVSKKMTGDFLGEVEEVVVFKRPAGEKAPYANEFRVNYEMFMYENVLDCEMLKSAMSKIDAKVEIHFYYYLGELDPVREKVLSETIADNRRKAELMAKQLHRNIIGTRTVVYGEKEEKSVEAPLWIGLRKPERHDLVYAGKLVYFEEEGEEMQVQRQFKLERVSEDVIVTEKVYMEWLMV